MSLLETQHRVASQEAPPPLDASQFTLFEDSQLVQEIKDIDLDKMTPLEAINRLAEIKRNVEGK
ncbi:MAG: hypothetical protein IH877_05005 [Gemmatimonadetes bacterium]|nr:hypothetical protein [Gemmatimonadota bacterium]